MSLISQQIINVELAPDKYGVKFYQFKEGYGLLVKEKDKREEGKYSYKLIKYYYPVVQEHITAKYDDYKDVQWKSVLFNQKVETYYMGGMLLQIEAQIQYGTYLNQHFALYTEHRTIKQTVDDAYQIDTLYPIGKVLEGYHIKRTYTLNKPAHWTLFDETDYVHPSYNQKLYFINALTIGFEADSYPRIVNPDTIKLVNTNTVTTIVENISNSNSFTTQAIFRDAGMTDFTSTSELQISDYVPKQEKQ